MRVLPALVCLRAPAGPKGSCSCALSLPTLLPCCLVCLLSKPYFQSWYKGTLSTQALRKKDKFSTSRGSRFLRFLLGIPLRGTQNRSQVGLKDRDGCSEGHSDLGQEGESDPKWHCSPVCCSGLSLGLPWQGSGWEKVASLCP